MQLFFKYLALIMNINNLSVTKFKFKIDLLKMSQMTDIWLLYCIIIATTIIRRRSVYSN